jgi:hypothetical protein
VVFPRIKDEAAGVGASLRALATTNMATEHVERLLNAVPEPLGWEIGEAFADCMLQADPDREIHWPWNTVRDRRTPRGSLPGADLVGFCRKGEDVLLLFGEVKTSSDRRTPPQVMNGVNGMTWQLEQSVTRLDIQATLLHWLFPRCQMSDFYNDLYKRAVARYLSSKGTELLLVGVLLRDTPPSERDIVGRASDLANTLRSPMYAEIIAWYLPVSISDWPGLLKEADA